jgi:hypothetical protein
MATVGSPKAVDCTLSSEPSASYQYFDSATGKYKCPDCGASASKRKYLTRHMKENCKKRHCSRRGNRGTGVDNAGSDLGHAPHAVRDAAAATHQADAGWHEPGQLDVSVCGAGYDEVGQSEKGPTHSGPSQMGPSQMGPSQMGPSQMGPSQMGPSQMGPSQTGPVQMGPSMVMDELVLPSCGVGLSARTVGGDGVSLADVEDGDGDAEPMHISSLLESLLTGEVAGLDTASVAALLDEEELEEASSLLAQELSGVVEDEVPVGQTVQGLTGSRDDPIFPGAGITVLQAAYLMLSMKREGHIRDNVFDMVCRAISDVLLPSGNLFPRSLYLMRRVIGCRTTEEVSVHVCVNDCCVFGRVSDLGSLSVSERDRNRGATCEHCGERKFMAKAGKLQPRKTFQYFGVKNAIRRLFADPEFVRLRGKDREDNGYYQSPECRRLHEAAGVDLHDSSASVYDIGLDWGQVYDKSVHSMGIVVLRCADLPPTHRSQRRFCVPVALIPGPREPKELWTYLQFVAEEFAGLSRTAEQIDADFARGTPLHAVMTVQQGVGPTNAAGTPNPTIMEHIFLCSGVYGDTPAQKKVSCSLGHSAYLACHQCTMRGVRGPNGRGMYFPVSADAGATYGMFLPGERDNIASRGAVASSARPCNVGDADTKLEHDECVARAEAVESGVAQSSDVGCHGFSPFLKCLPYLHYVNAFPLPVAHAALQGICKMLLKLTVEGMSNAQKRIVRGRDGDMSEPADVGRRYKCICHKLGHYTMEDLVNFLEFGCVRVLDGVLDPDLANVWRLFRQGMLFFLRERHVSDVAATAEDAWDCLYAFGKALHARFGVTACKYNLHIILCRILDQERNCGEVRQMTEYWIEMMVQFAKSSVRYRTTRFPEKVLAADMCMDEALHVWQLLWPGACLKTFDEWLPNVRSAQHRGQGLDEGDADGNLLLGNGKALSKVTNADASRARAALRSCIRDIQPEGWDVDDADTACLTVYQYADLHTFQNVYSKAYTRATRRVSHLVRCKYEEGDGVTEYIADVRFFVLARSPNGVSEQDLRLGVSDLFELQKVQRTLGCAWTATYPGNPSHTDYGVRLQEMSDKMVMCACDEPGRVQFIEYGTTSGTGRFGKGSTVGDTVGVLEELQE